VRSLEYSNGKRIEPGDRVVYRGEPGEVEFVVFKEGDHAQASWYLEQFPGGGVMVTSAPFGSVFVGAGDVKEDVVFVERGNLSVKKP